MVTILLTSTFAACDDDANQEVSSDVTIKSYMPTSVMANCEMIITGTNLDQVTSVVFPGDIQVNSFDVVTSNQIKVIIPAGVAQEGGALKVVTENQSVESDLTMKLAAPKITTTDPGDEVKEGENLVLKGNDLEFITQAIFPSANEGESIIVDAMNFLRKSNTNIKVKVPAGVAEGIASVILKAFDGTTYNSKAINILPAEKDPEGTIIATIQNVASELYLTRNSSENAPKVMGFTGQKDQEFAFIPIGDGLHTYYIVNKQTQEYMILTDGSSWQMGWTKDPTTLENPANATYRIITIPGLAGCYQIKNMGSSMLGTDATDNNSEVYADKNGMEEPKFQWRFSIINDQQFDFNVIWDGKFDAGDWGGLSLEPYYFYQVKVGDTIRIHFTLSTTCAEDAYRQIHVQDKTTWSGFPNLGWAALDNFPDNYADLAVNTQDIYDRLVNPEGVEFVGCGFVLTKIEILN